MEDGNGEDVWHQGLFEDKRQNQEAREDRNYLEKMEEPELTMYV